MTKDRYRDLKDRSDISELLLAEARGFQEVTDCLTCLVLGRDPSEYSDLNLINWSQDCFRISQIRPGVWELLHHFQNDFYDEHGVIQDGPVQTNRRFRVDPTKTAVSWFVRGNGQLWVTNLTNVDKDLVWFAEHMPMALPENYLTESAASYFRSVCPKTRV